MTGPVTTRRRYFVPQPSPYPALLSFSLLLFAMGFGLRVNGILAGQWFAAAGAVPLVYVLVNWFGRVIAESEAGLHHRWEDRSFRLAMIWFIVSEVVLFATFFGVLFYERVISVPWLASLDAAYTPWAGFTAQWPTAGPAGKAFEVINPWGIPAINTMLLVSSGITVTLAHEALMHNQRKKLIGFLAATVLLGVVFLALQFHEFYEAYTKLGLTLGSGVYGATFFMLTGLHGFHVTVGAVMLTVILMRCLAGHFEPKHHFAFEGVSWYWHFVDVVWLLLFVFVYWL